MFKHDPTDDENKITFLDVAIWTLNILAFYYFFEILPENRFRKQHPQGNQQNVQNQERRRDRPEIKPFESQEINSITLPNNNVIIVAKMGIPNSMAYLGSDFDKIAENLKKDVLRYPHTPGHNTTVFYFYDNHKSIEELSRTNTPNLGMDIIQSKVPNFIVGIDPSGAVFTF